MEPYAWSGLPNGALITKLYEMAHRFDSHAEKEIRAALARAAMLTAADLGKRRSIVSKIFSAWFEQPARSFKSRRCAVALVVWDDLPDYLAIDIEALRSVYAITKDSDSEVEHKLFMAIWCKELGL